MINIEQTQTSEFHLSSTEPLSERTWQQLISHLPLSLAVREMIRIRALLNRGSLAKPILDIGCGDGLFWKSLLERSQQNEDLPLQDLLGIDINPHELALASARLNPQGGQVLQKDICVPFNLDQPSQLDQNFETVIANCSLEHVTQLTPALQNIHKFLKPGGTFYLFVPSPKWSETLRTRRLFERISPRLGGLVGGCFDGFFQHRHLYPADVWKYLLEGIGFEVEVIQGLGSTTANGLFENNLLWAYFCFAYKALFKRYPRWGGKLRFSKQSTLSRFLSEIDSGTIIKNNTEADEVIEFFIACKKRKP